MHTSRSLTPLYGRLLAQLIRPFPNFDFSFIKPVRIRAIELLMIRPGDRVLDAGCGPGGSFPFLVDAVGPTGEVVAIEISPSHSELARRRIARNQWRNVEVIEAAAQEATLTGNFDGLVMFAAPDIYDSMTAWDNLLPRLKENARVVAFGAKLANCGWGRIFNPVLKSLCRLSFSTTPRPDREPGRVMQKYVDDFAVEEYFFGSMFLASGTVNSKKRPTG